LNWYKLTKFAGTIEPPPKMVENIFSIVQKFFTQQYNKPTSILIPIDLEGWKYGNEKLKEKTKYWAIQNSKEAFETYKDYPNLVQKLGDLNTLTSKYLRLMNNIHLNLSRTCLKPSVNWQPNLASFNICIPTSPWYIIKPEQLKRYIKHELSHFAQTYLTYTINGQTGPNDQVIDNNTRAGLPPRKIRTPKYDQGKSRDVKQYYLDDNEFYPLLQDAIHDIKEHLSHYNNEEDKLDRKHKIDIVKRLIMVNPFLQTLKRYSLLTKKYNEALKEIYKAVLI
jgi:hypothetical protein